MSRRPGIGAGREKYLPKQNYLYLSGHKKRLPRYYKDKMFTKEEKVKLRQKTIIDVEKQYQKDLNYLARLGYEHPVAEYIDRTTAQAHKKPKYDPTKTIF